MSTIEAVFGGLVTPAIIQPNSQSRVIVTWRPRSRGAYMVSRKEKPFIVRKPLILLAVENVEPARVRLHIENPTAERVAVMVTVRGWSIAHPLSADEQVFVDAVESWLEQDLLRRTS